MPAAADEPLSAALEVLARAGAALDDVAGVAVAALPPPEIEAWLVGLTALQAKVEAAVCRSMAEIDVGALPGGGSGQRHAATVAAAATGVDPRPLRAAGRTGAWLPGLPVVAEAFAAGTITRAHVEAIRRLDRPRTRRALVAAQGYLVDAAVSCPWPEFRAVLRYWELGADPDGDEPRDQVTSRACHVTRHGDGTVDGRFRLDPLAGQAVLTALERQTQVLWREDERSGSERTATQRRADALVQLLTGQAGPGVPSRSPLVHLVVGEDVAAAGFRRAASRSGDGAGDLDDDLGLDPDAPTGRCETIDGVPLHPDLALATLATATLRRLVLSADAERLDLGRSVRTFPTALRQLLLARARGRCQHPGCDAPPTWLQADHLIPWSRGGPTSAANGQILCDPHNKAKRDRIDDDPPERGP